MSKQYPKQRCSCYVWCACTEESTHAGCGGRGAYDVKQEEDDTASQMSDTWQHNTAHSQKQRHAFQSAFVAATDYRQARHVMHCTVCERFKDSYKQHTKWTLEHPATRLRLSSIKEHEETDRHKANIMSASMHPENQVIELTAKEVNAMREALMHKFRMIYWLAIQSNMLRIGCIG